MRRTLIVGLGSTGRDICDDILRRIVWSSGDNSLSKVPWLDTLVLETEQRDGLPSMRFHKYVSLVPKESEISAMIARPADYDEALNLSRWSDASLLIKLPNLAMGAGGMRMAGRLAFFSPAVFSTVKKSLEEALKRLNGVDEAVIRSSVPTLPAELTLDERTQILVVGTLGGGTASGCFLDLAYLIRRLAADLGYPITVNGYFTLPSIANTDSILRANTFAGLQEWNHFLTTGTTYRARFPDGNGKDYQASAPPFDRSSLLQTPDGMPYDEFKSRIGDYLYSLATSLDFSVISGKTIDGSVFMNGEDKIGATRRWATIGIRSLEFPADRLVQGCSLKLIRDTLDRLLAPPAETGPSGSLLTLAKLNEGSLRRALDLDSVIHDIQGRVDQQSEVLPGQIGQVLSLSQPQEGRTGFAGFPAGYLATLLGGKAVELRRSLAASIGSEPAFMNKDESLPTISDHLTRLEGEIRAELARLEKVNQAGKTFAALKRDEQTSLTDAALSAPAAPQKQGCLGFMGRGAPPDTAALQAGRKQALKDLIQAVVDEHFNDVIRPSIYGEALAVIALWQGRLNGVAERPGMRQYLTMARDAIIAQLQQVQNDFATSRSDYMASADIDEEYRSLLERAASNTSTEKQAELIWQRDVIALIDLIPKELLKGKGESDFDTLADAERQRVRSKQLSDRLAPAVQVQFNSILRRPILERLNNPQDALRWLVKGEEMLNFKKSDVTQREPQTKQSFSFLFHDASALESSASSQKGSYEQELKVLTDRDQTMYVINGLNPHRISVVKDFSGFSINAVEGCGPNGQFRRAYAEMNSRPGEKRDSRDDVAWTPTDAASMRRYHESRRLFLIGLVSGMIQMKRAGLYEFNYRVTRAETLKFVSVQWADNAATLYQDRQASQQLIGMVEDWAKTKEIGPAGVVSAVRNYSESVLPSTGLREGDAPLRQDTFLESIYQFWKPYPEVKREFLRMNPEVDPSRRYYFSSGSALANGTTAHEDGYFCRTCGTFLGKESDEGVLDNPCMHCTEANRDLLLSGTRMI